MMTLLLKELLQIALGVKWKLSRTYTSEEWQMAFKLAERQGVLAICFGAIEMLCASSSCSPKKHIMLSNLPDSLKMRWIGASVVYRQKAEQYKQAIQDLTRFYHGLKIKVLLMKGYGLSLNYPVPEYRPVGDIDIFLFGQKDFADSMVEKIMGLEVNREYCKHSHFMFHNVIVENHETFVDDAKHKSNVRNERILEDFIDVNSIVQSPIQNCYLPSATWNALFLMLHTGEHFAANKITLRHVLDLGTFFVAYYNKIDWNYILKTYEEVNLRLFYDIMATICVRDIGLCADCFCGYHHNEKYADRVLADIFTDWECSTMYSNAPKEMGLLKYGIIKSTLWWRNRWKYKMVYKENYLESFISLALNRIRNR